MQSRLWGPEQAWAALSGHGAVSGSRGRGKGLVLSGVEAPFKRKVDVGEVKERRSLQELLKADEMRSMPWEICRANSQMPFLPWKALKSSALCGSKQSLRQSHPSPFRRVPNKRAVNPGAESRMTKAQLLFLFVSGHLELNVDFGINTNKIKYHLNSFQLI